MKAVMLSQSLLLLVSQPYLCAGDPDALVLLQNRVDLFSAGAKEDPADLCVLKPTSCDDWLAAGKSCSTVWSEVCPGINHESGNNDITLAEGCPLKCQALARTLVAFSAHGAEQDSKTKTIAPSDLCVTGEGVDQQELCNAWQNAGKTCTEKWSDVCPGVDHPWGHNDITAQHGCGYCGPVKIDSTPQNIDLPQDFMQDRDEHRMKETLKRVEETTRTTLCVSSETSCDIWIAAGKSCSAVWRDECPGIDHYSGNNAITLAEGCPGKCVHATPASSSFATTLTPGTEQGAWEKEKKEWEKIHGVWKKDAKENDEWEKVDGMWEKRAPGNDEWKKVDGMWKKLETIAR